MDFKPYESVKSFYQYHKTLYIRVNIFLSLGKFMWKLSTKDRPACMQEIYHINKSTVINSHENGQKYILSFCRTSICKSSSAYQGSHTWNNNIPTNIKRCETYGNFFKKIKLHLLGVEDL